MNIFSPLNVNCQLCRLLPRTGLKKTFPAKKEKTNYAEERHTHGLEFVYFCIYIYLWETPPALYLLWFLMLCCSPCSSSHRHWLWNETDVTKVKNFLKDLHPRWSSYSSVLQSWWQEPSWSPSWSPCHRPSPCPLDHRWTRAPKRIICFR